MLCYVSIADWGRRVGYIICLGAWFGDRKATLQTPFHNYFHMPNVDRAEGSNHGHPTTDSVAQPVLLHQYLYAVKVNLSLGWRVAQESKSEHQPLLQTACFLVPLMSNQGWLPEQHMEPSGSQPPHL